MKKYNLSLLFLLFVVTLQAATRETQKRKVSDFISIRSSASVDVIVEQTGQYALEVTAPEKYMENIITEVKNGKLHIYVDGSISYFGDIIVFVQVKDLSKVILSGSGDFDTKGELKAPEFMFRVAGSGDFTAELNSKIVNGSLNGSGDATISGITESLEIRQSGSGDIRANELHLLSANLRMSGSGDCKFSGSTDYFELSQSGSGDFSGRDFDTETAKIRKSSSGDARVNIAKSLDISISGSGDLYYSGKPEFTNITVIGSGDIVKIK
ncbi:MAG: DUF2807 domain-containing protein [Bacteroidales bacterium]|jgi:hypothetical protein|nr:DUF2807 domain-containing protein [Bacteroidales bacterium]